VLEREKIIKCHGAKEKILAGMEKLIIFWQEWQINLFLVKKKFC
jgi:hypothetical protein